MAKNEQPKRVTLSAEEILSLTQDAVADYIDTKGSGAAIQKQVHQLLDKQLRLVILAMLGLKSDYHGRFEIDSQSRVGQVLKEHADVAVRAYIAAGLGKIDLTPKSGELAAMVRNAKSEYDRKLREAIRSKMLARANEDAARIVASVGDEIAVIERMAAELRTNPPEQQAHQELDNTFANQSILANVTVVGMVSILEGGSISGYVDDPIAVDVRFLVAISDKILRRTAMIVVDDSNWQPAHIARNADNDIDPTRSHLIEEFTHSDHMVFTLMGSADRDVIAAAVHEFTAEKAQEAEE